MLGEAMPAVEPELHQQICQQFKYGSAWVKDRDLWFSAAGISLTNVLALRPAGNKLESLCGTRKEVEAEDPRAGGFPSVAKGKYLRPGYLGELLRLERELTSWNPPLVCCLGNTAIWALAKQTNIGSIRGTISQGSLGAWTGKILPTYHPAGVMRNWSWRPTVVADLMKAAREMEFPEIRRPNRWILIDPSLSEVMSWVGETLLHPPEWLSPDIETASGQITCIGFASSTGESLVIPFWDRRRLDWSYWNSATEEGVALSAVKLLLESSIPKVGQNFIYDLQYLTRYGIRPQACIGDTMLLHHSLFPEMQKGLGFLGSIYTNEASWKLMRKRKTDSVKKDE